MGKQVLETKNKENEKQKTVIITWEHPQELVKKLPKLFYKHEEKVNVNESFTNEENLRKGLQMNLVSPLMQYLGWRH